MPGRFDGSLELREAKKFTTRAELSWGYVEWKKCWKMERKMTQLSPPAFFWWGGMHWNMLTGLTHRAEAQTNTESTTRKFQESVQKEHSPLSTWNPNDHCFDWCVTFGCPSQMFGTDWSLNLWMSNIFQVTTAWRLCLFAAFEGLEKASYDWCLQQRRVNKKSWSCRWLQSCSWKVVYPYPMIHWLSCIPGPVKDWTTINSKVSSLTIG